MRTARKHRNWRILRTLALIIALLTFTPLVTPQGESQPMLFGIPYTLWVGFVQTVVLVVLTYLGTRVHPGMDHEQEVRV